MSLVYYKTKTKRKSSFLFKMFWCILEQNVNSKTYLWYLHASILTSIISIDRTLEYFRSYNMFDVGEEVL